MQAAPAYLPQARPRQWAPHEILPQIIHLLEPQKQNFNNLMFISKLGGLATELGLMTYEAHVADVMKQVEINLAGLHFGGLLFLYNALSGTTFISNLSRNLQAVILEHCKSHLNRILRGTHEKVLFHEGRGGFNVHEFFPQAQGDIGFHTIMLVPNLSVPNWQEHLQEYGPPSVRASWYWEGIYSHTITSVCVTYYSLQSLENIADVFEYLAGTNGKFDEFVSQQTYAPFEEWKSQNFTPTWSKFRGWWRSLETDILVVGYTLIEGRYPTSYYIQQSEYFHERRYFWPLDQNDSYNRQMFCVDEWYNSLLDRMAELRETTSRNGCSALLKKVNEYTSEAHAIFQHQLNLFMEYDRATRELAPHCQQIREQLEKQRAHYLPVQNITLIDVSKNYITVESHIWEKISNSISAMKSLQSLVLDVAPSKSIDFTWSWEHLNLPHTLQFLKTTFPILSRAVKLLSPSLQILNVLVLTEHKTEHKPTPVSLFKYIPIESEFTVLVESDMEKSQALRMVVMPWRSEEQRSPKSLPSMRHLFKQYPTASNRMSFFEDFFNVAEMVNPVHRNNSNLNSTEHGLDVLQTH